MSIRRDNANLVVVEISASRSGNAIHTYLKLSKVMVWGSALKIENKT